MNDLAGFAKQVMDKLALVNREPHWEPGEATRHMADVGVRHEHFLQVMTRLISTIIRPRLEILAGYFANASLTQNEPAGYCSYWFDYSERFPASTKVALYVEHDVRFEKVAVCYEACMIPLFIKFTRHDRLALLLDEVKDDFVASWVEERLLEFLDAYLQIDRGGEDFSDETVTDPVCGMRINRSSAVASDGYRGHPYFFCSRECRDRFTHNPQAYVEVRAM